VGSKGFDVDGKEVRSVPLMFCNSVKKAEHFLIANQDVEQVAYAQAA
jgi:hypothetical protein